MCVFSAQEEFIRNMTCSDTSTPANTWLPRSMPLSTLIRGGEGALYPHCSGGTGDST